MFLKSSTELPLEFELVRAGIGQPSQQWLQGPAADAGRYGRRVLVDVGLEVGGHPLRRSALVEMGEPVMTDRVATFPIWLEVEEHRSLFPTFGGSLDAAWLGAGCTQLTLNAWYDPPFGLLGRLADRTLFHRVAEAVAQRFLQGVAERLTAQLRPQGVGSGAGVKSSVPASR